ncbi:pentapeptide repeat-containing protein [Nostoc sp. FACHB-190]|nr:pentapeptide repeat-containing protein [Nostoc sp. FACHB-190]
MSFTNLSNGNLLGAELRNLDFSYAKLRNIKTDETTNCEGAKIRNTSW